MPEALRYSTWGCVLASACYNIHTDGSVYHFDLQWQFT